MERDVVNYIVLFECGFATALVGSAFLDLNSSYSRISVLTTN
jgi:hypothetical protein